MPNAARLLALLVSVLALAGCVGPGDPAPAPTLSDPTPTSHGDVIAPSAFGALEVLALTPDLDPVEGARVEIGDRAAPTDVDGRATIGDLAPGNHTVVVSKDGWRSARLAVTIVGGQTEEVAAKLFPGDDPAAAPPANASYEQEFDYNGVFDCSLTFVILTGDCLLVADFVVNETLGLPVRPGDATEDQNAFEFPLDVGWESVVVEMAWEAPFAPIAEKMQLALEPSEAPSDGHAAKYARVAGTSPLSFTVHRGVAHETASVSADGEVPDMPHAAGGEVVMARAYILGEAHNPGGTDFLGVGAAYGHEFHIYVTVFYGHAAAAGFSRIPA